MQRWHTKTSQFLEHGDDRIQEQDKVDLIRLESARETNLAHTERLLRNTAILEEQHEIQKIERQRRILKALFR